MSKKIEAECTWGHGPAVLVYFDGKSMILHEEPIKMKRWKHGLIRKGSFDLTANEALQLASDLLSAARQAVDLDISIMEYELDDRRRHLHSIQESTGEVKEPTIQITQGL